MPKHCRMLCLSFFFLYIIQKFSHKSQVYYCFSSHFVPSNFQNSEPFFLAASECHLTKEVFRMYLPLRVLHKLESTFHLTLPPFPGGAASFR